MLITAGQETVYEKAKAIEAHLRTIPYNDAIDAPPADADPVEYFLYDIQEGYCDYYATSMTVMLRSLGIPARTASGYAEGNKDQESGITTVAERDAHTWVEVYFPEYGWIEFEPTAQESDLDRPEGIDPSESGVIPGRPDDLPNGPGGEMNPYEDEFNNPGGNIPGDELLFSEGEDQGSMLPPWVWALLTPILLLIGLLLARQTKVFGPSDFTADQSPILYERMHGWSKRLGFGTAEVQTPYEQAGRLGRVLPEGKPYIDEITDAYVHYSFSDKVLNSNTSTDSTLNGFTGSQMASVADAWRRLRTLFWKKWVRDLLHLPSKDKQDPYSLTKR